MKKKISIDSVSSMRLYLPVVPVLFGTLFLFGSFNGLIQNILLGLTLAGVLLTMLRLTVTFNSRSKTIVWRFGIVLPIIPYRTIPFEDVAQTIKKNNNVTSDVYNTGTDIFYKISNTYHNISLKLKKDNKEFFLFGSTNRKKVDEYHTNITEILRSKK